jgi:hypothetical protein
MYIIPKYYMQNTYRPFKARKNTELYRGVDAEKAAAYLIADDLGKDIQ